MKVPADIFREYDIRGIVGRDLTPELAFNLGCAIGTRLQRQGGRKIVVGRDCRASGTPLSNELQRGLQATGCDVTDVGMVPTPVLYWAIHHLNCDGGIQVTGSHNPPEYNGFKLTLQGASLHGKDIQELRRSMEDEDYELVPATQSVEKDVLNAYLDELVENLRPAERRLKIVVDAGNGTGGMTAVPLYERMGHEVISLYCEPDGTFPNHHADPTVEENLTDLRQAVQKHQADVGLAFDGDADRIGVIDRTGEVIWGDRLMILLSRDVLAETPGAAIVGEVKCSKTLYDDIDRRGGQAIMWRTGHSLIKSKMKATQAALAGEMSGHIFYKHRYYGFDDAVYAGGRLLEILGRQNDTISELLADVPAMVATPEIRVPCSEAQKFELVNKVLQRFQAAQADGGYNVVDIDGARVEWPDGWGLVRPSNTQPILVLRFEAGSQERVEAIKSIFDTMIEEARATL